MFGSGQQLPDARQGDSRRGFSCLDGFAGAAKIVPRNILHVGADHQVGVAFPNIELELLRGADGAGHHLKNVFRSIAIAVLRTD